MALITLTGKDTSEAFRLDDSAIIYADTITGGSRLTISDNKVDTRNQLDVSETPSAIAALTTKLIQITKTDRSSAYINVDRIVEIKNSADSSNNAVLMYDDNGDEFKEIKINETIAVFMGRYNTGSQGWVKYSFTYEDWQPAGVGIDLKNIILCDIPAGGIITGLKAKHSESFSGGGVTLTTFYIKDDNEYYYTDGDMDVTQAVGNFTGFFFPHAPLLNAQTNNETTFPNHAEASTLRAELYTNGVDLDGLDQGAIDVWVKIETVK